MKQKVNLSEPDLNLMMGTSMADISILEQFNGNSTIGGSRPVKFSGDDILAIKKKDDYIEAFKPQIKLIESSEAAQNIRIDDLTE